MEVRWERGGVHTAVNLATPRAPQQPADREIFLDDCGAARFCRDQRRMLHCAHERPAGAAGRARGAGTDCADDGSGDQAARTTSRGATAPHAGLRHVAQVGQRQGCGAARLRFSFQSNTASRTQQAQKMRIEGYDDEFCFGIEACRKRSVQKVGCSPVHAAESFQLCGRNRGLYPSLYRGRQLHGPSPRTSTRCRSHAAGRSLRCRPRDFKCHGNDC